MTARSTYTLHCDAPGCRTTFTAGESRANPTRSSAKAAGWAYVIHVLRGMRTRACDYCPSHAVDPLVDASSVGEGLRRLARDGADVEAERAAAELTPDVMAQVEEANVAGDDPTLAPFLGLYHAADRPSLKIHDGVTPNDSTVANRRLDSLVSRVDDFHDGGDEP